MESPASEYRAFLGFDLSGLAQTGTRIVSARLRLHPVLAAADAHITHHACLLADSSWRSDDVTWQAQPDAGCVDGAAPCCGGAIGSWEPKPARPSEVELTFHAKAALARAADKRLSLHLYSPGSASSREHYYVQYGSSRRGDAASRPELVLDAVAPTSARESQAEGKGLHRALVGTAASFVIEARDADGSAQALGGDAFKASLVMRGAVVNASVSDVGNGSYAAYYTPSAAGVYRLEVTLGGVPLGESPYRVEVFPGPTSPSHCTASGPGLVEATAGLPATFLITSRDSFGNARPLETKDVFTTFVARRSADGRLGWQNARVTDLLNGSYAAEYTVQQAGPYVVQVRLGGINVMGSPYQAIILPARTEAHTSYATGDGLKRSTVGRPSAFTIVARDAFRNARTACGDRFEVLLSGPERERAPTEVHGIVNEFGNGTYEVEYTLTVAGLYYISVTLDGRHVGDSPYAMQSLPSEARASHSVAYGPRLAQTAAGNLTEFHILAKDGYGNAQHSSAKGNFSVIVEGPAGLLPVRVHDGLSGLYTVSYSPKVAAGHSVSIFYNGLPIFGSPYSTIVRAGRSSAAHAEARCRGDGGDADPPACATTVGIAGEVMTFEIRSRDTNDNPCTSGGEPFDVILAPVQLGKKASRRSLGAMLPPTSAGSENGGSIRASVLDTDDGLYRVTYRAMEAGEYSMSILARGQHIAGSPFRTTVQPGATCSSQSAVSGVGASTALAGGLSTFGISAADCYGNAETAGGDQWSVLLTRPGVPNVIGAVRDSGDGGYVATYNATIAGQWLLHVKTGGVHVEGSPFSLTVRPGPADAPTSIAVGSGKSEAIIGEVATLMVRTKDAYGNDRGVGGDSIRATLVQGSSSQVVHAEVIDAGDGSYTLRYTLHYSSGSGYLLSILVDGGLLGGSALPVRAIAGPMACEETISVSLPRCIAGAVSEGPIFAKDRNGNQRSSGGDTFTASLELVGAPFTNETVQVLDNGDGTHRAMWVVTRATSYRLWVASSCGPIKGSPYKVECQPAALSVTHSYFSGFGHADAVAGELSRFSVVARDVFDNVLREGSYTWAAALTSTAWVVPVKQHAGGGGSYSFEYNTTRAGVFDLVVGAPDASGGVNGSVQVQGSPALVTVRAGPLSGPHSKVFGPTPPEGDGPVDTWSEGAGKPVRLWIEARDRHSNPHETAIDPSPFAIAVRRVGVAGHKALVATVRAANKGGTGAYTADLVLGQTGDYLVSVVAELPAGAPGEPGELLGSPYHLSIRAGPTSAYHCTAAGPGLDSDAARVGRLMSVLITARDMHGNPRSSGGDRFALALEGPKGARLAGLSVVDFGNGTYSATYLATVAGDYKVYVRRADDAGAFWDVARSPFRVYVANGPASASVSRLVGPHEVAAGDEVMLTIMTRDEFGNAPVRGEHKQFEFTVDAVPRAVGGATRLAKVLPAGHGNYTVLHQFADAGEYILRASLAGGGGALPDLPLHVKPGALSPPHCELLLPCYGASCVDARGPRTGFYVNWPVRFLVLPFDAYGNRRADGGRAVEFAARVHGPRQGPASEQLQCAPGTELPDIGANALYCRAQPTGNGEYAVAFTPLIRGDFVVNVSARTGPFASRKLGNVPGSLSVRVETSPAATCAKLRNCSAHGHCNYLSGRCVCDAGFDGLDCSEGAASRRTCPNDCSGHGYCSDATDGLGRNLCHCAVDYRGADCSTWVSLLTEPAGGGPFCPNGCSGHGLCNETCGECACEPGWGGDDCSLSGEHFLTELATDGMGRQQVLDFAPATRRFAVYAVHKTIGGGGELSCAGLDAKPVCSGHWPTVVDSSVAGWSRPFLLAYMAHGMLLQYEPSSGAYVLLSCDGSCDGGAPCSQRLALGHCSEGVLPLGPAMRASYVGMDTVLFHNSASGAYTLHKLSRDALELSASDVSGCIFEPPFASGAFPHLGSHHFTWLGGELLLDYEPARGNYSVWRLQRGAVGGASPLSAAPASNGHLMATSRTFVGLGGGVLLVAGGASTAYQVWDCATDEAAYGLGRALPCRPVGQAEGVSQPHSCPSGCGAGECNCPSLGACTAQPGCGWCADTAPGVCMRGRQSGPVGQSVTDPADPIREVPSECFAWNYGAAPAAREADHSYGYLRSDQLLDYSAADGRYRVWRLASPPKPGCPAVQYPPDAAGTLAVVGHSIAPLPPPRVGAFALLDYEPHRGDYRLGSCNRSLTRQAGRLDCHTSVNGTWHAGGLQLLWVGRTTLMRYSRATGEYSLWRFSPLVVEAATVAGGGGAPFDAFPLSEGTLLRGDGKRLRYALLSYLGRDTLLASELSSGYMALFRRTMRSVESSADVFLRRWESSTILRGWHPTHVGGDLVMLLKPATAAYRTLNCSALFSDRLPSGGLEGGSLAGPPCTLLLEGSLPDNAPCNYDKAHCLMAPSCGWCQSSSQCVPANEDGVCSGSCAHGQLLYGSLAVAGSPATEDLACEGITACDQCAEQPQCGWCGDGGSGSCMQATDAALGECGGQRFVQHDSSGCVAADPLADLTDQVAAMRR